MATIEERISRLEGGYEHLATKADLYRAVIQLAMLQVATVGLVVSAGVAFLKLTA